MNSQFKPRIIEGKQEENTNNISLATPSLEDQASQALTQYTHREKMAMIPSLAKEMARVSWQADLEIHRIRQAERVANETLLSAAVAIAGISDSARKFIEAHPEAECDVQMMVQQHISMMTQLPRIATVAYFRRYYQTDLQRRDP